MKPVLLTLAAALLGAPALAQTCSATSGATASHVVELYTSEGCDSCPPADRWLSQLPRDGSVLALAFHVDYWDYLGWRDRFGQAAFTERQRAQQRVNGSRFAYTPQVVVDGQDLRGGWRLPAARAEAPFALRLWREGRALQAELRGSVAGLRADEGQGGAATLIQRFGSAANLNIHLHCLVLDGVYRCRGDGVPTFVEVGTPSDDELHALLQTVIARLMKLLTRRPRLHLIRFHGVLAPNAKLRPLVVPQGPEVQEQTTAQGPSARGGARLRHLSCAGRRKHLPPRLHRQTTAGASSRHASARHHRNHGQPWERGRPRAS